MKIKWTLVADYSDETNLDEDVVIIEGTDDHGITIKGELYTIDLEHANQICQVIENWIRKRKGRH